MPFSTIVASLSSTESYELDEALGLVGSGGSVHVLRAVAKADEEQLRAAFDELRAAIEPRPDGASLSLHVRRGERAEETLRLAAECDADLIILGDFERGAERDQLRVVESAECSVLALAPAREAAQTEGFVPKFKVCRACSVLRRPGTHRWFCEVHEDDAERLFARLDDAS